jgi:hypothetical protein
MVGTKPTLRGVGRSLPERNLRSAVRSSEMSERICMNRIAYALRGCRMVAGATVARAAVARAKVPRVSAER